ncbi:MAG: hypothetical protein AAGF32_08700, partial [Pseudomonadota bacterium]
RFRFAAGFVAGRAVRIKDDITALNGQLAKVVAQDESTFVNGTRNDFLRGLSRQLDLSVARFNTFRTDPQLSTFRTEFADRAEQTVFPNGSGGTFSCPDPQLQVALRGAVKAIDLLPELEKPVVNAVEGSEAIVEAFRRLTVTLYGVVQLKMPPSPDELRAARQKAIASLNDNAKQRKVLAMEPGLGERDYIPLFIALFVDFCLLLVSVSRPMNGFQWLDQRMGEAQEWPVIKILGRFRDIHQDEEIRQVFDVFRHVVFDWRGVYYAAIPLNGTDPTFDRYKQEDLAIDAQLLTNLFASFENERVFTRTPVSFFTTSFIQKKLREQGSKFSEAEAFRIYRFRKDMWQDWMLSAMMGAARRVEKTKQQRALENDLFGSPAIGALPGADASVAGAEPAVAPAAQAAETIETGDALRDAMQAVELSIDPSVQTDDALEAQPGNGKTGDAQTSDAKSGDGKSGDASHGDESDEASADAQETKIAETITRDDLTQAVSEAISQAVAASMASMQEELRSQRHGQTQPPFRTASMDHAGLAPHQAADFGGHGAQYAPGGPAHVGASVHQLYPQHGATAHADPASNGFGHTTPTHWQAELAGGETYYGAAAGGLTGTYGYSAAITPACTPDMQPGASTAAHAANAAVAATPAHPDIAPEPPHSGQPGAMLDGHTNTEGEFQPQPTSATRAPATGDSAVIPSSLDPRIVQMLKTGKVSPSAPSALADAGAQHDDPKEMRIDVAPRRSAQTATPDRMAALRQRLATATQPAPQSSTRS